jgi:hypothetical protein
MNRLVPRGEPGRAGALTRAALGAGLLALAVAACGGGSDAPAATGAGAPAGTATTGPATTAPPTPADSATPAHSAAGADRPVACTTVTDQGGFASSGTGTKVTLEQIGKAVGFKVTGAMPDTQSAAGSFRGYEGCRYQFDTPAGGALVDLTLVVGTNPLDGKTAAEEFAGTRTGKLPLSRRDCTGDACAYTFTALPGVGDQALAGDASGSDQVVIAQQGQVYVEVGPGQLKGERMVRLAKLIVGALQ